MLLPLQGAFLFAHTTQGVTLGYVLLGFQPESLSQAFSQAHIIHL